jgi:hypothetical protein
MRLFSWLRNSQSAIGYRPSAVEMALRKPKGRSRQPSRFRARLEAIEDRCLPSTLTVLNTNDSGPSSLRDTIAAAQSGDTIAFDPSLAGQTINLTSGELAIGKSLDIEGLVGRNSRITVEVAGNIEYRVFDITSSGATVILAHLGIQLGLADHGGGILNQGGSLSVNDCTLQNNVALGGGGGGIFSAGGGLTITGGLLSGNAADGGATVSNGGAVYMSPGTTVAVTGTGFFGNVARTGFLGNPGGQSSGGAIYDGGGPLTVSNSQFVGNDATWEGGTSSGGALYIAGGRATISNTSMVANEARTFSNLSSAVLGGAIYEAEGQVSLSNCDLGENDAQANIGSALGGAIYEGGGSLAVNNCSVESNLVSAGATGGGAIHQANGALTIANTTLDGNRAYNGNGGAIYIAAGTLTIVNSDFLNNFVLGLGQFGNGGAIYVAGGLVCVSKNTTFTGNSAQTSAPDIFGSYAVC